MRTPTFLYIAVVTFFLGVALRSLVFIDLYTILFFATVAGAVFAYYLHARTKMVLAVVVALGFFVMGIARFGYAEWHITQAFDALDTTEQVVEGIVVGEVVGKETTQRFTVETDETRVIVTADRFPSVSYGDVVTVSGALQEPESFETETGRTFNYPQYLAARSVTHQMFYPEVTLQGERGGSVIVGTLFSLKDTFLQRVQAVIPEPHAALLGGLVVGTQEALGDELLDAFRITGLIHIVVLSGYNVTIVAESIMRFFGFLPRRAGLLIGGVSIVLFAILTGASATIVRASIMALLVLVARATKRTYVITRALFITALAMVLYNPYVLLFDPSFQLSFLATLGLIYFVPLLEQGTQWMKRFPTVQSFVLATIATQLFVLPLLLYQVGTLSTVSIPVNVLALPVVPTVMFFGLLTGLGGFVHTLIAWPFGFVTYMLLGYILKIVEWFSLLPFAAVQIDRFPLWGVLLLYALYAGLLWYIFRHKREVFTQA